jgi:AAT family amino acid transporter
MKDHPFKSPLFPYANYAVVLFLLLVLIGMSFNEDTRVSLLVGLGFCTLVSIGYFAFGINKKGQETEELSPSEQP